MRIRFLPMGWRWNGEACPIVQVGRFVIWLCPVWFPGWQLLPGHWMVFIIPGLAFGRAR